jgi:dihydropteroate synthase
VTGGAWSDLSSWPPLRHPVHEFGRRRLDFAREIAVMAIVNRTPDSFSDRGRTFGLDAAVRAAEEAIAAGAQWVDIGGQPFRAGLRLSPAEELDRVLPVVEAVRDRSDVVLSIDTFEPDVAARCLAAGADVVNDTTGLRDPDLAAVVADAGAHVLITHSLAAPRTAYPAPRYDDVVDEVRRTLADRVEVAIAAGIEEGRILLDPGHDLNKTTEHSLELTRRFGEIAALGLPTVAAVSNKDFVGETLGLPVEERLAGSLAVAVVCMLQGACVIRMHDATAAVRAARMTEAVLGLRAPATAKHNLPESEWVGAA